MSAVEEKEVSRWGTRIIEGSVNGHPCRMYADRPRAMAELLLDAERWGEREFIVQGKRRFSAKEHHEAVARVAERLRNIGVRAGDRVLIQGFNHIEWLATFWALHCIGATVGLGNAWWSAPELADAVQTFDPFLAIVDHIPEAPLNSGVKVMRFAELRSIVDDQGGHTPLIVDPVNEEAPALVIFSSGTTGKAKGVQMSQRSVIANVHNLMRMTGRLPSQLDPSHPGTVSLVTMPLFHLGGMQISIMTMLSGGKIVFLDGRFDPEQVLRLMQDEKVRAWGSVPTMVSRVIQHPRFAEFDTSSVSSVQMGGAVIPHELRTQVQTVFPKSRKRVGSMYGHTEAGGVLATGSSEDIDGRPGCVGRPLPAVEIRISNPNQAGVGEIMARTPTATDGYLGDAKPIADKDGWIPSGDLGRMDTDGLLYVVGRSKDMIIRAGENIASAHVEHCLRTHEQVLEVAVVAMPHQDLGEEVAAAVVLRPGASITVDELQTYAASQLAKFEVPSRWWLGTEPLPTNATGKIIKNEVISRWPTGV
ncbi:class I adenylate-forming enzyme family protein [Advenella kashmirensis]